MVGSKSRQRFLNHFSDVIGLTIKCATILVIEAEFACDRDFIADRRERFSHKLFVRERALDLGCIEECDALFMGRPDDVDALIFGRGGSVVGADAHAAKAQFRDFQCSELSCLHLFWPLVAFFVAPGHALSVTSTLAIFVG